MQTLRNLHNNRRRATGASGLLKSSSFQPKMRVRFRRHETNLKTMKTIQEVEQKKPDENIAPSLLSHGSSDSEISDYFSLYTSDTFEPLPTNENGEDISIHGEGDKVLKQTFKDISDETVPTSLTKFEGGEEFAANENNSLVRRDIQSLLSMSSDDGDSVYIYSGRSNASSMSFDEIYHANGISLRSSSISFDEIYQANGINLSESTTSSQKDYEKYVLPGRDGDTIQRELDDLCSEDDDAVLIDEGILEEANFHFFDEDRKEGVEVGSSHTEENHQITGTKKDIMDHSFQERNASPEVRDVGNSERNKFKQTERRAAASPFSTTSSRAGSTTSSRAGSTASSRAGVKISLSGRSIDLNYSPLSSETSSVQKGIHRVISMRTKRAGDRLRKKTRKMEAKTKSTKIDISERPLLLKDPHSNSVEPFRFSSLFSNNDKVQSSGEQDLIQIFRNKEQMIPYDRLAEVPSPYKLERKLSLPEALSWSTCSDVASVATDFASVATPLVSNRILDTRSVQLVNIDTDPRALAKYCEQKNLCEIPESKSMILSELEKYIELGSGIEVQHEDTRPTYLSPIPVSDAVGLRDHQHDFKAHLIKNVTGVEEKDGTNLGIAPAPYHKMIGNAYSSIAPTNPLPIISPNAKKFSNKSPTKIQANPFSAFTPINPKINEFSSNSDYDDNDEICADLVTIKIDSPDMGSGSRTNSSTYSGSGIDNEQSNTPPRTRTISTQTFTSLSEKNEKPRQWAQTASNVPVKNTSIPPPKVDSKSSSRSLRLMPQPSNYNTVDLAVTHRPIRTSLRRLSPTGSPGNLRSRTLVSSATHSFKRKSRVSENKFKSSGKEPKAKGQGLTPPDAVRYSSRASNTTISSTKSSTPLLPGDLNRSGEYRVYERSPPLKARDTLTSPTKAPPSSRTSNTTISSTKSSTPLHPGDLNRSGEYKVYERSHLKARDTLTSPTKLSPKTSPTKARDALTTPTKAPPKTSPMKASPKSLQFWAMAQKRAHEEKDVYRKAGESQD